MSSLLNKLSVAITNIFGFVCPLCHDRADVSGFCVACLSDFYHERSVCPVCAEKTPHGQLCGHCQKKRPFYDALFVSFELSEILLNLIHVYKYQRNIQLSGALSKLMLQQTPSFPMEEIDLILSVPISEQRLKNRGFNQSHLLAKQISKRYHKPLISERAFTRKERLHQAILKYKERQENIKNVFTFVGKVSLKGKKIMIVDDIATTGSTVNELARILKKSGASLVYVWVLAKRTQPHNTTKIEKGNYVSYRFIPTRNST